MSEVPTAVNGSAEPTSTKVKPGAEPEEVGLGDEEDEGDESDDYDLEVYSPSFSAFLY